MIKSDMNFSIQHTQRYLRRRKPKTFGNAEFEALLDADP